MPDVVLSLSPLLSKRLCDVPLALALSGPGPQGLVQVGQMQTWRLGITTRLLGLALCLVATAWLTGYRRGTTSARLLRQLVCAC